MLLLSYTAPHGAGNCSVWPAPRIRFNQQRIQPTRSANGFNPQIQPTDSTHTISQRIQPTDSTHRFNFANSALLMILAVHTCSSCTCFFANNLRFTDGSFVAMTWQKLHTSCLACSWTCCFIHTTHTTHITHGTQTQLRLN